MNPVPVFWCEPNGRVRRSFRAYCSRAVDEAGCRGYCEAVRVKDEVEDTEEARGEEHAENYPWEAFPTVCAACGREMTNPERQIFRERIYVVKTGPRAGETFSEREKPVGAMWDCEWLRGDSAAGEGGRPGKPADIGYTGPDGISLQIQLPDGEWCVDAQCSNCTRPQYVPVEGEPNTTRFVRTHYCWVREGDPRSGYVHVHKGREGESCAAGGGSIWQRMPHGFHGFVHRGFVVNADDRPVVDRMLDGANPVAPAERVLPVVLRDRPVTSRPVVPPPVRRPMTHAEAVAKRRVGQTAWRSNRR